MATIYCLVLVVKENPVKITLTKPLRRVMATLVVLSAGLLASCGDERTQPPATAPKVAMGQTVNAS